MLNFYKNLSNYYHELNIKNFKFEQDLVSKNAEVIIKTYHEVLLLIKFLQTTLQVRNMNIVYYDLYYTVIKNRKDKVIADDQYDYLNFNDFITPNHYIGIENHKEILR